MAEPVVPVDLAAAIWVDLDVNLDQENTVMKTMQARFIVIAAIFCLTQSAFAQKDLPADDASTAAFVELCKNPDDQEGRSFCFGFGEGVYQTYLANRSPNTKVTICFADKNETRNQILQKFLSWNKANPQFNQERAAKTLMRFFAQSYPCKQAIRMWS